MENKTININMVAQVANALQELRSKMVFVGGATISLYTDDRSADDIRPTSDIDMTVKLIGFAQWTQLQERLWQLGFSPDAKRNNICSYLYKGISVDIIPSEDSPIGKSNTWYKPGFEFMQTIKVENEDVNILSAPYFIATKFEAFHDRGGDYRTSHDFEDIIYVVQSRTTVVDEILTADEKVKSFLKIEFKKILESVYKEEILKAHIHPLLLEEQYPLISEKIKKIVT